MSDAPEVNFQKLYRRLEQVAEQLSDRGPTPEERARVLEARARAIAARPEVVTREARLLFGFQLGGVKCAVPLEAARRVVDARGLMPLPAAPRSLAGVFSYGGRIACAVDLGPLLTKETRGVTDAAAIVLVESGSGETFGLVAENVVGRVEAAPGALGAAPPGPFAGLSHDGWLIIDLERVLGAG